MDAVRLPAGPLVLRPHTEADIDGVLDQCTDPETQAWTTVPSPYSRADAEEFVRIRVPSGWASGDHPAFAIADARTDEFLGTIGLHNDQGPGASEIGFGLRPKARGKGVMSNAVRALADWAFDPDGLGISVLYWRAHVGNWGSRRVAWANGFRIEGRVRGLCLQRGARIDGWIGSLRADDPREPIHPWYDAALLAGEGIVLRPFRETDADAVVEACSDPRTQHWLGHLPTPYTRDDALGFIRSREEELASGVGITWAAADAATDQCVGSFGLMQINGGETAEVGYWVHPSARGRGVATSAVRLMRKHASIDVVDGGLGLNRLYLRAATANPASQRVAEKSGFERVGVERRYGRLGDNSYADHVLFDLVL